MTQDELDALPEVSAWTMIRQNGYTRPYRNANIVLQHPDGEEALVIGDNGDAWELGDAFGVRWKRRIQA